MRYRKISTEVDAFCFNTQPWPYWFQDKVKRGDILAYDDHAIVKTLEGDMRAEQDDWIVLGVKGEVYPVKAHIFPLTYEPVWT